MADDLESQQDKEAEDLFKNVASEEGARPVEIEEPEIGVHKSRSEEEAESPNISDLKSTLNKLFPKISNRIIDRVAKVAMVARIAPDVFLDEVYLTVTDVVEMWDEMLDGELDVQEVISLVYFAFSAGIDGKGRVDIIQVSANASESRESSTLGSALGIA
jgi:hypothetical protein